MAKIILDAGHGGYDNGASYEGRLEKDDNLRLALAVGQKLEEQGLPVEYTRVEDIYSHRMKRQTSETAAVRIILYHSTAIPVRFRGSTVVYRRWCTQMRESLRSLPTTLMRNWNRLVFTIWALASDRILPFCGEHRCRRC